MRTATSNRAAFFRPATDFGATFFSSMILLLPPAVSLGANAPGDRMAAAAVTVQDPQNASDGELSGLVKIQCGVNSTAVKRAVADLASDLAKVLGTAPSVHGEAQGDIVIRCDRSAGEPEAYRIDIGNGRARIVGTDELGVIYGVYRFSQEFLHVDPLWYFKDLQPEPRPRIPLPAKCIRSEPKTFRYRGWFINDEDLLTEWRAGGGARDIRYPFYQQVVHPDVIDRVCEAVLRSGGNLLIPASFVDVMNEPEAELIRRAVARGLYVSQHHIEPLGVSHFGFENYWRARGVDRRFAYGSHPEQVREVWRAYAQRWYDLSGSHIVWQLGLRGKGDRAIWTSDKSVDRSRAGELISRAIREQWEIVRDVDPRPSPPATVTLWLEGSQLMSQNRLVFPHGVTIVFCDRGASQKLQADFYSTRRSEEFGYGVYYHIGFWSSGPHLLQGSLPSRIHDEFSRVVAKGDTDIAIINVCNIREHVLGIQAATEMMTDFTNWDEPAFWDRFAPPCLHGLYRSLLQCFFPLSEDRIMQDGALFAAARKMVANYASGHRKNGVLNEPVLTARKAQLRRAIATLDRLVAAYPDQRQQLTLRQGPFYDVHLLTQARLWRELFAFYLALIEAEREPARVEDAQSALQHFLEIRQAATRGKWAGWYRGDKKVNVPELLAATANARTRLLEKTSGGR